MPILVLTPTRLGVLLCGALILFGPFYTVDGYSIVSHTVSQLGAQNTPGRWWMNLGFLVLGIGVGLDARRIWWTTPFVSVFFLMFAAAVAMMAVFSSEPVDPALPSSDMWHLLHAVFATAAILCFCSGAIGYGYHRWPGPAKWIGIGVGVSAGLLWLAAFIVPEIQGALQRLMYAFIFVWLAVYLPHPLGNKSSGFARTPWFASNR